MRNKSVWLIAVYLLTYTTVCAQIKHFSFPVNISASDYEPGVVWAKVKSDHKESFLNFQAGGRMSLPVDAKSIQPLVPHRASNKVAARLAPRKVHVDLSQYLKIYFDKTRLVDDYINSLYSTGYFEVIEPVYRDNSFLTPNDPSIANQYYLDIIRAKDAWDITHGNASIVIGIVDSGGDLNHPDIQNNIYVDTADPTDGIDNDGDGYVDNNRGWDFSGSDLDLIGTPGYNGDNDPSIFSGDRFGHGTMVAGCASASTNDGIGISGVGFNTKLLFTKHYADNQPSNSTYYSTSLYEGVYYAATHGAKIINCSWGNANPSSIAQDLIKHVTLDLGCLVIAAAGNSNTQTPLYPAAYDYVLSVASSDQNDLRSWFSNYGKSVDIIAPGSIIFTTNYDNGYKTDSGTSLAAPIVAGAAALVWAQHPEYTAMQVGEQLRVSADETFYANNDSYLHKLGKGRLDIYRALTMASPSIRATNQVFVNATGESPGPGEQAQMSFDFTNYLQPSSSLSVTLSTASPYVNIIKGEVALGALGTNTTKSNATDPFELSISPGFPIDETVELILTFSDGAYQDTQLISFVMPSFIDITENNINTTIASAGRIGYANTQGQNNGLGFRYNGSDASVLFEMGIIMGTDAAHIYDNVRGTGGIYNQDFTSAAKMQKNTLGERSFSEVKGAFRNAPIQGMESVVVNYTSMVWQEDPYKNFVILEYKIKNTSDAPLTNFHMGLFADWDLLFGGASDLAAWDIDTRLGYAYPAQPSTAPHVGIQALKGNPNYYAIDNDQTLSGNPWGIYDGFTDAEKYQAISGGLSKIKAGNVSGSDISHVVSVGPYAIAAGGEITVAFALHAGVSMSDLFQSAKYADSLYNYTFTANTPLVGNTKSCAGEDASITATGATKFHWYKDAIGGSSIHSGPQITIPSLLRDTVLYVSNADENYESLRTKVSITAKSLPTISYTGALEFCEGASVILTASQGDEYLWSNGATTQSIVVANSGTYAVSVNDAEIECLSLPATVIVNESPSPQFEITIDGSNNVTFLGQDGNATTWLWDFGDGESSIDENPAHTYTIIGNYTVSLTVATAKGCSASASQTIGIITGTEPLLENIFQIYPNPVHNDKLLINRAIANDAAAVEIYNMRGELMIRAAIPAHEFQTAFDLSTLSNGVYLARITAQEKTLINKFAIAR